MAKLGWETATAGFSKWQRAAKRNNIKYIDKARVRGRFLELS